MKELKRIQFGNPLLRQQARQLKAQEISSDKIQQLINDMRFTLEHKKLGVGLAAPQVGESLALAVIAVRPTNIRPQVKPFDLVLINPQITSKSGAEIPSWEGCISAGSQGQADLFAKVPRHTLVRVKYLDAQGRQHHRTFKGLSAQIIQHEVDHLNGILFVDRVKDSTTFMTYREYLKMIKANDHSSQANN